MDHAKVPQRMNFQESTREEITEETATGDVKIGRVKTMMGTNRKHALPHLTGNDIVILNNTVSSINVEKKAKKASLQIANSRDFSARGQHGNVVEEALSQADGVVFDKLKLAVIKPEKDKERFMTATSSGERVFLKREPERYLYACVSTKRISVKRGKIKDNDRCTWGIDATNVLEAPCTGKNVNVAILDTGFNFSHPDFEGRDIKRKSFIRWLSPEDGNGHGTHCAGIAAGNIHAATKRRYGVAGGSNLFIAKVLNSKGKGRDANVFAAIEWALENNGKVVSMSFGLTLRPGETYYESYESVARTALRENNCLFIAAAGNESDRANKIVRPVNHPANCPSIIAVAAVTPEMEVANFSCGCLDETQDGGKVNVSGPGVNIFSSWKNGLHKIDSGTSMATPFVTGMAALLWEQFPKATGQEIWDKLMGNANKLKFNACDVGAGLIYHSH